MILVLGAAPDNFSRILCKLLGVLTNNHFHGAIC